MTTKELRIIENAIEIAVKVLDKMNKYEFRDNCVKEIYKWAVEAENLMDGRVGDYYDWINDFAQKKYFEFVRQIKMKQMDEYNGERFVVVKYSWDEKEVNPDEVYEGIIRIGDNREMPENIDNQVLFSVANIDELKDLTKPNNGSDFIIVDFVEYNDNAIEDYNEIMEKEAEVSDDELIMRLIVAVLEVKRMLTEDKDNGIDLAKCDLRSPNGEIYWFPETLSQFKKLLNGLKEEYNGKNTEDCSFLDIYQNGENEAYFIDVVIDIIRNSKGNIVDFIA